MWRTRGHDWAVELLRSAVDGRRVAHSYLITGPESVGKTLLAHDLAAALFCASDRPPCGACNSCTRVLRDVHPDLTLVEPEAGTIKIDQIRDAERQLALSPYEAPFRACIINGLHRATTAAANASLKTIEEPPGRVVIILTALDASLLLPTIVSRCQVIALRAAAREEIEALLCERWPDRGAHAALVARLAAGRIGWAIRAMEEHALLETRQRDLGMLEELLAQRPAARILAAERLSRRDDLPALLMLWQGWWRDVLLIAAGCDDEVANRDRLQALEAEAQRGGLQRAWEALCRTQTAIEQLEHHANPRLALEVLLLEWARREAA